MRTAVVFGSGHVARPAIRTLLETGHRVLVATNDPPAARAMLAGHPQGEVLEVDAANRASLRAAAARGEGVISLLPVHLHVRVAEACLDERRHFVSTSYTSEEMRALEGLARRRKLVFLNEIGADPGVDHMQAARAVHRIREAGGRVRSLRSVCGGLPAPEAADNPFRYKLSWTPHGVVMAGGRPARYLEGGELVHVPAFGIFDHPGALSIPGLGDFESLPNGDSLRYLDPYGLQEPETLFRGTLRWAGWSETWAALCRLGYLDDSPDASLAEGTWAAEAWHAASGREGETPRVAVARALRIPAEHAILDRLEWLGLFLEEPMPENIRSRADLLAWRMGATMRYGEGERDMLALVHEIEYTDAHGAPHALRSHLTEFGEPGGDTAMARMVGRPAALALGRILDGTIRRPGVRIPVDRDIWEPVLADLARAGVEETEENVARS
jgi:saccharopine dehydrogenase-like NADP-dependent oxidoreductase